MSIVPASASEFPVKVFGSNRSPGKDNLRGRRPLSSRFQHKAPANSVWQSTNCNLSVEALTFINFCCELAVKFIVANDFSEKSENYPREFTSPSKGPHEANRLLVYTRCERKNHPGCSHLSEIFHHFWETADIEGRIRRQLTLPTKWMFSVIVLLPHSRHVTENWIGRERRDRGNLAGVGGLWGFGNLLWFSMNLKTWKKTLGKFLRCRWYEEPRLLIRQSGSIECAPKPSDAPKPSH